MIKAVPMEYKGTWFQSTLEADWAATFDMFGWDWEYEPTAVRVPNGEAYRPDFHLPAQNVWCEVKGPHNKRLHKASELQRGLLRQADLPWSTDLVVVLRPPGPGDVARWDSALTTQDLILMQCGSCQYFVWMDHNGPWSCRHHMRVTKSVYKPWLPTGGLYWPGQVAFVRAPRSPRNGVA